MIKALSLNKLGKEYLLPTGGRAVIVSDFDLIIERGEFVCLIGHSGCGKSTVLSMVAGLVPASDGWMNLDGSAITGPGPDRGVVFQSPCLLPWMTAHENVLLGVQQVHTQLTKKEREELAAHYLTLVGLSSALNKRPAELSAGMRQRVGIARAFALDPKMLLLDEPFGMLDSLTRFELQQVLIDLWTRNQKTALMVTHDVDEALFLSDRIVMMTSGPAARVGGILHVPFPRPRDRTAVLEHPDYYTLRERLLSFLEFQDRRSAAAQITELEPSRAPEPTPVLPDSVPLSTAPIVGRLSERNGVHVHSH